jgi:hypothetical protein
VHALVVYTKKAKLSSAASIVAYNGRNVTIVMCGSSSAEHWIAGNIDNNFHGDRSTVIFLA